MKEQFKERNTSIDILRGIAILTMTFTHIAVFTSRFTNSTVQWFSNLGGDISYTLFLFCFGAAIYYSYLNQYFKKDKKKIISKTAVIFLIYLGLSVVGLRAMYANKFDIYHISLIFLLKMIIPFTEFFISFVIISLITILIPKITILISRSPFFILIFGITIYVLSIILYKTEFNSSILPFFVGKSTDHYFPALMYISIFWLGIYFAKTRENKMKYSMSLILTLIISSIFLIGTVQAIPFNRFPPTISFLLYGICWTLGLLLLVEYFITETSNKSLKILREGLSFLGKNSLLIFTMNTLIIFSYKLLIHKAFDQWYITVGLWIASLILSICLKIILNLILKWKRYRAQK